MALLALVWKCTLCTLCPPQDEKLVPQPFAYEYGVKDEYTGAAYQKTETQNDYGVVQGSYKVGGQFS